MVMVSPGVTTKEKDYSAFVSQSSSTIVGCVGGATKGPVNEEVLLTSPQQFLDEFGEPTPDSYAGYAALQFLQEGNQMYFIRVGGWSDPEEGKSSLEVTDGSDSMITISAKTPGSWGDDIAITTKNSDEESFDLEVIYEEEVVEEYECSLDMDDDNYVEDEVEDSDYIEVKDEADGDGVDIEEVEEEYLEDGDDGLEDLESADILGDDYDEGMKIFEDSERIDINLLIVPGESAVAEIGSEMIALCEDRGDCMAVIDPPMGLDVQEVMDWVNGEGEGDDDPEQALNTSYAAVYWSWLEIYDEFNEQDVWVPPSGFVVAQYAYNDRQAYPWFAPAGLKRGRLIRAQDVEHSPRKGERDSLYEENINPIVNFATDGITIWGQKTLQRQASATDRVNVRRLLLMIRKAIANSTRYIVFDPNDEFLWNEWKGFVNPYLQSLKDSRAFYDFRVEMGDESTISDQDIDENRMPGRVMVQPTKSAEFIPITFALLSTGAEFPE